MEKKERDSVIKWTIDNCDISLSCDSVAMTKSILKNMGIPLPQGNVTDIKKVLATNDYMGWRSVTVEEAKKNVLEGRMVLAIVSEDIYLLTDSEFEARALQSIDNWTMLQESDTQELLLFSYSKHTTVSNNMQSQFGSIVYNGEIYPIYVPYHHGPIIGPVYETVATEHFSSPSFNLAKFIAGLDFPDESTALYVSGGNFEGEIQRSVLSDEGLNPAVAGASVFLGLLNSALASVTNFFVNFYFQQSSTGSKRVIIKAGSSAAAQFFEEHANDVMTSAYYSHYPSLHSIAVSLAVEDFYEEVTGLESNPLLVYDCHIKLDSRHRELGGETSFLWMDGFWNICETPIICPNDEVKFCSSISCFGPHDYFATVDLNSSRQAPEEYQQLFLRIYD